MSINIDHALNTLTVADAATNANLVLSPKGSGALLAQFPDSTAVGGNARGANAVDLQTVRALASHVASGSGSTVLGGTNNIAVGAAAIAGGNYSQANGYAALALGEACVADAQYSVCLGAYSGSRLQYGKYAFASGSITAPGDAQLGAQVLRRQTTDATVTRLTSNNAAASTINTLNLPNFGAYFGRLRVMSKAIGSLDTAVWDVTVGIVRGNGAATTVMFLGANAAALPTGSNGTGSTWRLAIAADTTNGGIAVSITGAASTTINSVATFNSTETVTTS